MRLFLCSSCICSITVARRSSDVPLGAPGCVSRSFSQRLSLAELKERKGRTKTIEFLIW